MSAHTYLSNFSLVRNFNFEIPFKLDYLDNIYANLYK